MPSSEVIDASPGKCVELSPGKGFEVSPGSKFVQKSQDLVDNLRRELERIPVMDQTENAKDAAAFNEGSSTVMWSTNAPLEATGEENALLLEAISSAEEERAQAEEKAVQARQQEVIRLQNAKEEEDARLLRLKMEATRVNEYIQDVAHKRNLALAEQAEKYKLSKDMEKQARAKIPETVVADSAAWAGESSQLEERAAQVSAMAEDLAAQLRESGPVTDAQVAKSDEEHKRYALPEDVAIAPNESKASEVRTKVAESPAAPVQASPSVSPAPFSGAPVDNLKLRFPDAMEDDILKALTKHNGHAGRAAADLLKKVKDSPQGKRVKEKAALNLSPVLPIEKADDKGGRRLSAFAEAAITSTLSDESDSVPAPSSLTPLNKSNKSEKSESRDDQTSEANVAEIREQLRDCMPSLTSGSAAAPRLEISKGDELLIAHDMGATPNRPSAPPPTPMSVRSLSGISTNDELYPSLGLSTPHGPSELTTPLASTSLVASSASLPPLECNEEAERMQTETEVAEENGKEVIHEQQETVEEEKEKHEKKEEERIQKEVAEETQKEEQETIRKEQEAADKQREKEAAEEKQKEEQEKLRQQKEAAEKQLKEQEERIQKEKEAAEEKRKEEQERLRKEQEAAEKLRKEEEVRIQKEKEAAEEKRKEEQERLRKEEEAAEKLRKEEEERIQKEKEVAEAKRKEEQERLRKEEEAAEKQRKEEEERHKKEETERIQKEKEAAEAKRKEEQERVLKEKEVAEKQRKEEEERQKEQERIRKAKEVAEETRQKEQERIRKESEAVEQKQHEEGERCEKKTHEGPRARAVTPETRMLECVANGTNYHDALSEYWNEAGFECSEAISGNQTKAGAGMGCLVGCLSGFMHLLERTIR